MIDTPATRIQISLCHQLLQLWSGDALEREFSVSTSRYGPGEAYDSLCTPRGRHVIRARIGSALPEGTVFAGRRPTGETFDERLAAAYPDRDWVLSRILWLSGCEPGRNRLGQVDTMRRFIYIHGAPDFEPMGVPRSHGCIRMRNCDVIELFDLVAVGCPVAILD